MAVWRRPLPPQLVEQARAYTTGAATPAEPRDAATVVLLRERDGLEVYLLRRQASMAFAAGMCVFPGGGVDPRDFDDAIDPFWAGPTPAEWATRLGIDDIGLARALVCAAVRETFEESGVLLAGPDASSTVADTTADDWEADRQALEARELAFTDFLTRRGLVLRTDLLGAWSGWTTPTFEPRRFRTWFFVAALPEGQATRDVSSESSAVAWLPVEEAMAKVEDGSMMMFPPTYITCVDVERYVDPAGVLAESTNRIVEMFTPALVGEGDSVTMTTPPGAEEFLVRREDRAR